METLRLEQAWKCPFCNVHDQNAKDCVKLKQDLLALCEGIGKKSWSELPLSAAYGKPKLSQISTQKKYRIPDDLPSPKEELYRLLPKHQQIEGAKWVAPYMDIENNLSASFNQFVSGMRRFIQ